MQMVDGFSGAIPLLVASGQGFSGCAGTSGMFDMFMGYIRWLYGRGVDSMDTCRGGDTFTGVK